MTRQPNDTPVLVTFGRVAHRPLGPSVVPECRDQLTGRVAVMTLAQAHVWIRPAYCRICFPQGSPWQPVHAKGGARR